MRRGVKVSTAQASVFERHEHYRSALDRYPRVLYLCVGSAFTGNCGEARRGRSGTTGRGASRSSTAGRRRDAWDLLALAAARFARENHDAEAVIRFAREGVARCRGICVSRYPPIPGGRRTAFPDERLLRRHAPDETGDQPACRWGQEDGGRPESDGTVEIRPGETDRSAGEDGRAMIMIEYTDNPAWVDEKVQPEIARRWPEAEIILQPMSLTSGAHMGPGTWAVAFLPERR